VSVGEKLYSVFPDATVQATALSGQRMTVDGYVKTDANGVGDAFAAVFGTSQPIYGDIAAAMQTSPTLLVIFSDGIVTESTDEVSAARGLMVRGTPILAVTTAVDPTTISDSLQDLATVTGGQVISGGDFTDAAPVLSALQAAFEDIATEPVVVT